MVNRIKSAAFPQESTAAGNPKADAYLAIEPKSGGQTVDVTVETMDGVIHGEGLGAYEFGAPIRPDELWSKEGYPPWKGTRRKVWNGDGSR